MTPEALRRLSALLDEALDPDDEELSTSVDGHHPALPRAHALSNLI